jgi:hypothetical protein
MRARSIQVLVLMMCHAPAWSAAQSAVDHAPLAFRWYRGAGAEHCASEAELAGLVQNALQADGATANALVIEGTVQGAAAHDGFNVSLQVLDASGQHLAAREFASEQRDCVDLTSSIVLVAALLVELGAKTPLEMPAAKFEPSAAGAVKTTPRARLAPSVERAQNAWFWRLCVALGLAVGLNPDPSFGPVLSLQLLAPTWFSLQLRTSYWSGGEALARDPAGTTLNADFKVYALELAACLPGANTARWRLAGCLGPTAVLRVARLFGSAESHDSTRMTAGLNASLQASFAISRRLFLAFDAALFVFGRRDRYVYAGADGATHPVFALSYFAHVISLGLGMRL